MVTKLSFRSIAASQFSGSSVNITCEGRPYLGVARNFTESFVGQGSDVSAKVLLLAKIAESQS